MHVAMMYCVSITIILQIDGLTPVKNRDGTVYANRGFVVYFGNRHVPRNAKCVELQAQIMEARSDGYLPAGSFLQLQVRGTSTTKKLNAGSPPTTVYVPRGPSGTMSVQVLPLSDRKYECEVVGYVGVTGYSTSEQECQQLYAKNTI